MWRLNGHSALLEPFGASVEIDGDRVGLHGLPSVEGPLLAVSAAGEAPTNLQLEDAYVRGNDLVVSYRPQDVFPFRAVVYWRVEEADPSLGQLRLTVIISVETDLLDTLPVLDVTSAMPAEQRVLAALTDDGEGGIEPLVSSGERPNAVYCSAAGGERLWLEAIHPSDRPEAVVETASDERFHRWRLFSRFLEKGVIRRARLTASLSAGSDPLREAMSGFRAFASQAPPLTV